MAAAKSWKAKILLVLIALVASLLVAEIGLRIVGFSHPYFYDYDEHLGWVLRPGTSGWFTQEGRAYIEISGAGLRDREHQREKPANTFRVAVIGDSFAEALQVPTAQTFWTLMESNLQACPQLAGRKVEVLNFGVSNYGTAQELIMLRQRVWDYSPDAVVLAITLSNDVRNNSRALERDELRPYFVFRDNELVEDASFRDSAAFRQKQTWRNRTAYSLINRSRILQLVNSIREARQIKSSAAAAQQAGGAELGLDDEIYLEPKNAEWQEAWRVTEGLITLMNKEVTARGAKFLAVTISSSIQANPDPAARQAYLKKLGAADLFYPDRRIKSLGERENIPTLILGPLFQRYAEEHHVPLHGFGQNVNYGHWNPEGHQLAGELISRRLCELLSGQ